MNGTNIFLDDVRQSPENHVLVKTAEECMRLLQNTADVSHLSLDHDLGTKYFNGFSVVLYLLEKQIIPSKITIHSANAVGGKRMYRRLMEARRSGELPERVKILHRPLPLNA
ncbi:cyclic-phosphate processing receiver domain-containing protein [Marinococcus halotolerans]|jgi:hypothetical protein|uniref:cyclic-phosphate processing receiver domain-containing protein n=1 Tax=Marinococcus halotolerans TaxID=301092 RepID=UPI0003B5D3CE|nr:cyclic-phosphate processing receiver domain-containing protein [Marinococcus halotolerans]